MLDVYQCLGEDDYNSFNLIVCHPVVVEIARGCKPFTAHIALMWLLAAMNSPKTKTWWLLERKQKKIFFFIFFSSFLDTFDIIDI